ncbi:MAG: hypothetical protein HON53_24400 [Planctomycetaceae bacterium]|jgi:hypothetical protein|nr:hypothetical protein [Planctomycetaceae bacterium]MBT6153244.1 hypothetical protein [Planctomycetaceae bacterium]MBT6486901.1 hypothetical protein [Planctomycetaceae bacterium]MBT6494323.1 hypothetical protein [Planctomycetaceae bacterium]
MAYRLDDLVISGELINTTNYSTHGWLRLRGQEQALSLQLTGNCLPDLMGKHIRFEARDAAAREANDDTIDFDISGIAWQQVGPTGEMTADRKVKVSDCSPEEMYKRSKLGEPQPFAWKRCLYLEWFSQNGRVVLELVDPVIEIVDDDFDKTDAIDDATTDEAELALLDELHPEDEFGALTDAENFSADEFANDTEEATEGLSGEFSDEEQLEPENDDDPYGLFPEGLQQQFDLAASQLDNSIEDDESKPQSLREMELMDELIEGGEGDIIASIFEEPMKLPRPDQLDDVQVESALKTLLGQLARFGIALSVCEHFTPRDAYRLLLNDICTEERAYPQLRDTQWVQHFMTSEFCEICEAEMDREFEEYERRRRENPDDDLAGGDLPGDDEVPF